MPSCSELGDFKEAKHISNSHESLVQQGINQDDFSRPMYKNDLFYTGSVQNLAEFKSHNNNVVEFTRSNISVAVEKEAGCAQKHPALKLIIDILKEMTDFKLLGQNKAFLLITLANFFAFAGLLLVLLLFVLVDIKPIAAADAANKSSSSDSTTET